MRADLAAIEVALVAIERQVRITCENDRNETAAKRADPIGTMVEISLSHVTDAVKRIRDLLDALSPEVSPAPRDLRKVMFGDIRPISAEEKRLYAIRNIDSLDCEMLIRMLPDSGHGKFWQAVARDLRDVITAETQP